MPLLIQMLSRMVKTSRVALACICICGTAPGVMAQSPQAPLQSPILIIDSERLYKESVYGDQVARELERRGAALAAENRELEATLRAEEQELTDKRPGMAPAEFRELADAFDRKVQNTRRTQEAKGRALAQRLDAERLNFLNAAAPILEQLMREAGAEVILEQRSVFLSATAIDITQTAIDRINAAITIRTPQSALDDTSDADTLNTNTEQ